MCANGQSPAKVIRMASRHVHQCCRTEIRRHHSIVCLWPKVNRSPFSWLDMHRNYSTGHRLGSLLPERIILVVPTANNFNAFECIRRLRCVFPHICDEYNRDRDLQFFFHGLVVIGTRFVCLSPEQFTDGGAWSSELEFIILCGPHTRVCWLSNGVWQNQTNKQCT